MEGGPPTQSDLAALAKERVTIGPIPERVIPCDYDPDFKTKVRHPFTHLLIEQQAFPERGEIFFRIATRLDTMQAVQQQSQWRVEFEPQTQSVVLHSVKVRRGSLAIEHLAINRIRFLQRETGLDGCVVNGWVTLLLLLEDIRPADVLEYSYSISTRPRILPQHFSCFFTLPPGAEIGRYSFSVHGFSQRNLRWKSSSNDFAPVANDTENSERLVWEGSNVCTPEIEEYTPPWQLAFPWVQVSDFSDWQSIAGAVLSAWPQDQPGEAFFKLVEEIKSAGPGLKTQILKAIQSVQDGFRYLSLNLELGGTIPAPAETVVHRRFGDCKDLAFLLVKLLRELGVSAAPVLVHTAWRESLSLMLPSPTVFNHVVVEFHFEDQRRWVDPTMKGQGGLLNRFIPDYGLGLVLQPESQTLMPPPAGSLPVGSLETKESFILDTAGNPSYLGILTIATGWEAENLRFEFDNSSVEAVAKKHLQYYANRFSQASRMGELLYRDDRERNEFIIAEAFEIQGFLRIENQDTCNFSLQSDLIGGALAVPSGNSRRAPFALPFPCHRVHTVEIDFAGLDATPVQPAQIENDYFNFSRKGKGMNKFWRVVFTLNTLADSVRPEGVKAYRQSVQQLWEAIGFQIRLPRGFRRMRKPSDFGMLPLPKEVIERPPLIRPPAPARIAVPFSVSTPPAQKPEANTESTPPPASETRDVSGKEQRAFSHPSRHRRRETSMSHRRLNRKSVASVYILASAVVAFVAAGLAGDSLGNIPGGLIALFCLIAWPAGLTLGFIGWRQCRRHPERYRGKNLALVTLSVGGFLSLLMVPAVIIGTVRTVSGGIHPTPLRVDLGEDLKFDALKFRFRSPTPPWNQIDARTFGPGAVLAFGRPEPMFFSVCVNRIDTGSPGALQRVVGLSRAAIQQQSISYQLLKERELNRNGLSGWQTESRATFQGREFFLVHWYVAEGGFGYQLAVWGAPGLEESIRDESEKIFRNFELTTDLSGFPLGTN